jgi:hypothetical protein
MNKRIITGLRNLPIKVSRVISLIAAFALCLLSSAAGAAEKIAVFPQSAYDGYIIYQNLAIFWFFIIGLIVIIRMKIKEIERTQKLGVDRDDENAPRLK